MRALATPVPTTIPSLYMRQVGCAVESGLVAERRLFDSGFRLAVGERAAPAFVEHGGRELIPRPEHSTAEQIERKVEGVDHGRQGDAESLSHGGEAGFGP